ncbi:UDP-glucose/GDP-mannose dehydrogenase family protein [Paenibacillus sp. MER TA 81-3]|uniref:UDP-glucose dehydrogenase family protein n=1 Tax=Paenibacillus sp. MER TA 81-3 TaxID=2939573 RepID=UPI00203D1372|nr:UDP-glucose/GDP-mannose dehydrogenase family protein [Paenibacillus sp. MER TA 81-3]MCM3337706.1 UDP-glucose/GDP-mannose dehydrogenase family protein [Paenibacillus sp. MER TA 81-3]
MKTLVAGVGYVGTTTALLLAELGWKVLGFDTDNSKISALSNGTLPFYEPGLDTLLRTHLSNANICFLVDPVQAIRESQVVFICVGTPSLEDGSSDMRYIRSVAKMIGNHMQEYKLIVVKSTVPVGTQKQVVQWISEAQISSIPFDVVSNPEFLREGSAVYDAFHPDRIVIGSDSDAAAQQVKMIYRDIDSPYVVTKPATAEMIKYAANAFLAAKISYMNELARLCDQIDVSISDIAVGIGYDPRIGKSFLQAGIGYGGSCFPKDVKSLLHIAKEHDTNLSLLQQVVYINETQYQYFIEQMVRRLGGLDGKIIAVLGLSFKPGTDDLREAPSLKMISHLLQSEAAIQVHDPVAALPEQLLHKNIVQFESIKDTVRQADAVVICTEWPEYASASWSDLIQLMRNAAVFDGRNVLDGEQMKAWGYDYYGIGNG